MTDTTPAVRVDAIVDDIAEQLAASIAGLGFPVGMGVAPPKEMCLRAALGIHALYGKSLAAAPVAPGEGDLIADIEREMEGRARGYADVRGELLFRALDALRARSEPEAPSYLGHLVVPKSGVGAVFIPKGEPIPLMDGRVTVTPVYDGPQNVTRSEPGNDDEGRCDICGKGIKGSDICATDIDLGPCHAACLEGSPVVSLETGEELPEGSPVHTYRYDSGEPGGMTGHPIPNDAHPAPSDDDILSVADQHPRPVAGSSGQAAEVSASTGGPE